MLPVTVTKNSNGTSVSYFSYGVSCLELLKFLCRYSCKFTFILPVPSACGIIGLLFVVSGLANFIKKYIVIFQLLIQLLFVV